MALRGALLTWMRRAESNCRSRVQSPLPCRLATPRYAPVFPDCHTVPMSRKLVSASGYGPARRGDCRTSWHDGRLRDFPCATASGFTGRRFVRRVRQATINLPQEISPAARSFPSVSLARWRVALGYVSGFLFRDFTPETQSCGFTELHRLLHW